MNPDQIIIVSSILIMTEYNGDQALLDVLKEVCEKNGFSVDQFNKEVDKHSDEDYREALLKVFEKALKNQISYRAAPKRKAKAGEDTNV